MWGSAATIALIWIFHLYHVVKAILDKINIPSLDQNQANDFDGLSVIARLQAC